MLQCLTVFSCRLYFAGGRTAEVESRFSLSQSESLGLPISTATGAQAAQLQQPDPALGVGNLEVDRRWKCLLQRLGDVGLGGEMKMNKSEIDVASDSMSSLDQIDSARNHGILLEAVQVLTDLILSFKKAYIFSDGRWFMDGPALLLHIYHVGRLRNFPAVSIKKKNKYESTICGSCYSEL
ncbi:unnamed protein product [Fraxinus pennsylvanica]|uniref:ACT domain-containing protein ACR n=1 Tax=Fraxinus pennsylvanica TaxID=56036 RepID=A0AAD2ED86_9LAMI|nr:unnamed protein product [Fraxinus pennsylvanica]